MIILGIETSCDETALALIETKGDHALGTFECRIISSLIHSQAELHSAYGGVFPMLAKREHGKNLVPLLKKLIEESKEALPTTSKKELSDTEFSATLNSFKDEFSSKDPDLFAAIQSAEFLKNIPPVGTIAVTEGPGLEPTLWVGINFARILGTLWNIPVVPINHMEGHVVASLLKSDTPHTDGKNSGTGWQTLSDLPLPSLAFLISGGHTELVKIEKVGSYEIIGETRDDAVGEAFDKAARILGLSYPGGPQISRLSAQAKEEGIVSPLKLPRPMIGSDDLQFSFSGLKTAVLYAVRDEMKRIALETQKDESEVRVSDTFKKGLAYEFEMAVADTLISKLKDAIELTSAQSVIVGGGVSANKILRDRFQELTQSYGIPLFLPSTHTAGDNALMIALAGTFHVDDFTPRALKAHGTKRLGK